MVSLFKDRSPATIVWLFLLSIIVHSHFFVFAPPVFTSGDDGLISVFFKNYANVLIPAAAIVIYHAVVLLQALRINHLFTDHRMFSRVNYLPAMVYILLTGLFTEWSNLTPALIGNTFVIWLFAKTVHLYNSPHPKTLLFNIGMLIGISALLYHPLALLLPAAFFALLVLRPFVIAEWLVLLMGVMAPFYFLISYLYLTDHLHTIKTYIPLWQLTLLHVQFSESFFVTAGVFLLIVVAALVYWQQENRRLVIQVRKNWTVLLAMLFILLPLPFISKNAGLQSLVLCIVPASPIVARGFLGPKKNTLPSFMFWAVLIAGILKNWVFK